jgi:hypothetical protein
MFGGVFALLPYTLSWLILIVAITVQYSAHIEMAAVIFLALLLILLFYARMAAKESVLILLTVLAFYFKVPYIIPLLAGLYGALTAAIPITVGVFIWSYIPVVQGLVATTPTAGVNIAEMPATFTEVYTSLVSSLTSTQTWLFTAFIFAMVVVTVHVVSRLSIDFSKEIAILLGVVLNIFGFILQVLIAGEEVPLFSIVAVTILCGAVTEVIRLFDSVLDYQRAESVQFEDEHNYYYVKVVPKVILSKRKRSVRRIRPQMEDEE